MTAESYLSVKNWDEFQQYKDRDPKWIKLHRDILNNYEFDQLTETQQNHLIKIWLLASKLDNNIPNDTIWIGRQIGAKSKVDTKQLVTSGFLSLYENVQECTGMYLETETETETETDAGVSEIPDFVDQETWTDFVQHRKEKRQALKPTTTKRIIKDLTKWHNEGEDVNQILITSIRNGWTGIFKDKKKKTKSSNGSRVEFVPDSELEAWAIRNNAPRPKQQAGYSYDKYRADLTAWEQTT